MKHFIFIITGTVILCFQCLLNKFPFLTPESGQFIRVGFGHTSDGGGFTAYGQFIAHASWGRSLWPVVATQALMLAMPLYCYFHYYTGRSMYGSLGYLFYMAAIALFGGVSYAAGSISPGIFPSAVVLYLGLLTFRKDLPLAVLIALPVIASLAGFVGWRSLAAGWKAEFGGMSVAALIQQLANVEPGTWVRPDGRSDTFAALMKYFPLEGREYTLARQYQSWLNLRYTGWAGIIFSLFSAGGTILLLWRHPAQRFRLFVLCMLGVVLLLVLIETVANGTRPRPDAQYIWLLSLPISLYFTQTLINRYEQQFP